MPRCRAFLLVAFCAALNTAGFAFDFFEPIPLYDEIAHFLTPFTLVALTAEVIYRSGGDDEFFPTPQRSLITGTVIGLVGATGWEGIEILLDALFPAAGIYHALPDTAFDIVFGVIGGALGAWSVDRYLDRRFGRSRTDPHRASGFHRS